MAVAINESEIINYYDKCQVDYEIIWHLNTHMCMHYGFWDESTPNLRSALNNMNKQVALYGGVKEGDYVLDAGCGVGGSSIFLAKNYNCKTVGITLSDKQVASATENAGRMGVGDNCTFQRQSYLETNFPDNTFDVVWGVESVCYSFDKLDFLKEAFRVLKPGGKVVVADFFSVPLEENTSEMELMDKWCKTWAIKRYAEIEEFYTKMEKAGFANRGQKDATENVIPSIRRLYYSFFPGIVVTKVSEALGFRNSTQTANTWSTYYQYKAFKKGLWKYMLYTAEKPK